MDKKCGFMKYPIPKIFLNCANRTIKGYHTKLEFLIKNEVKPLFELKMVDFHECYNKVENLSKLIR